MEGPSLLILRQELAQFSGQRVLKVSGNTKQPKQTLKGCALHGIDTWGKQLFLTFVAVVSTSLNWSPTFILKRYSFCARRRCQI